jgi:hypothetical protein
MNTENTTSVSAQATKASSQINPNLQTEKTKLGRNPFHVKKPKSISNSKPSTSTESLKTAQEEASKKELRFELKWKNSEHLISYAFTKIPYQTLERLAWGACFTYAVWNKVIGKSLK